MFRLAVVSGAISGGVGQLAGTMKQERHPQLNVEHCTKAGGCTTEQKAVTIDANWRWTNKAGKNCYTGNTWDTTLCPDPKTCSENCGVDGAQEEYTNTYGVFASGAELKLKFVTQGPYSKNIGSRSYLLEDEETYKLFKLKNKEFTFDVDVSQLPCGLNGALYFVAMDADGGMSKYPLNKAGAKYGTGYCDAQCPHDIKFINGEANVIDWKPQPNDKNSGWGHYGSCCTEFDVWESNSISTAYTAHACAVKEQTRCEGADCGDDRLGPAPGHRFDGLCDKNGCDFQTFRLGDKQFWGPGSDFTIDTTKPVRVVTQFLTEDGTDTGELSEIRRLYKQGDKVIQTPSLKVGTGQHDSITTDYCQAEVGLYKDKTNFLEKGGMKATGDALEHGMVLALSLWDDHDVNMLWLDSNYPLDQDPSKPGVARGTCATTSGVPADVESQHGDAYVRYFNIRYGELNSTDVGPAPAPGPSPSPSPGPGPSPSPGPSGAQCCYASPSGVTGCGSGNCVGSWCAESQDHCTTCNGQWCPDGPEPSPTPPAPSPPVPPSPSGCPGGSLDKCIDLCPSDPTTFQLCVQTCQKRCGSDAGKLVV